MSIKALTYLLIYFVWITESRLPPDVTRRWSQSTAWFYSCWN